MRVVSGIPMDKAKAFAHSLSALLSGDYSRSKIDKVEQLNQKLKGWAQFYRHTDLPPRFTVKLIRSFSGNWRVGWLGSIAAISGHYS
jgi:RNA-directed DNA polymerase